MTENEPSYPDSELVEQFADALQEDEEFRGYFRADVIEAAVSDESDPEVESFIEAIDTERASRAALAERDLLTGLYNRRGLERSIDSRLGQVRRQDQERGKNGKRKSVRSYALILLDFEGFKRVNDKQGHDVGDELLRECGQKIERSIRSTDVAARLGGDEFAVCVELEFESIEDRERKKEKAALAAFKRIARALPVRLHDPVVEYLEDSWQTGPALVGKTWKVLHEKKKK